MWLLAHVAACTALEAAFAALEQREEATRAQLALARTALEAQVEVPDACRAATAVAALAALAEEAVNDRVAAVLASCGPSGMAGRDTELLDSELHEADARSASPRVRDLRLAASQMPRAETLSSTRVASTRGHLRVATAAFQSNRTELFS